MADARFLFYLFPVLETERLVLRQLTPDDADRLLQYYADPAVVRHLDWNGPQTVEQAGGMIEAWNRHFEEMRVIAWGIERRDTKQLIGTIACFPIHGSFERTPPSPLAVGFELAQAEWRQGFMTEALCAVVSFGFEELGTHRIQAEVYPENSACRRLLRALGFREEGVLRQFALHEGTNDYHDVIMLALLKDDERPICR